MKRTVWFVLLLLAMLLSACGGKSSSPAATKAPSYNPTVEVTPTDAPRKAVNELKDEFDLINADWSDPVVVTTQAAGGKVLSTVSLSDSKMVFSIKDLETYLYRFYKNPGDANVVIDSKFQAGGPLQNGIALVCRAKKDYSMWYEFRVDSTNKYAIYLYNKSLKENDLKNPYVKLKAGGLPIDKFHPTRENTVRAVCDGTTLTLETNSNKIASVQDETLAEAGLVGIGAMSNDTVPVTIKFDYLNFKKP